MLSFERSPNISNHIFEALHHSNPIERQSVGIRPGPVVRRAEEATSRPAVVADDHAFVKLKLPIIWFHRAGAPSEVLVGKEVVIIGLIEIVGASLQVVLGGLKLGGLKAVKAVGRVDFTASERVWSLVDEDFVNVEGLRTVGPVRVENDALIADGLGVQAVRPLAIRKFIDGDDQMTSVVNQQRCRDSNVRHGKSASAHIDDGLHEQKPILACQERYWSASWGLLDGGCVDHHGHALHCDGQTDSRTRCDRLTRAKAIAFRLSLNLGDDVVVLQKASNNQIQDAGAADSVLACGIDRDVASAVLHSWCSPGQGADMPVDLLLCQELLIVGVRNGLHIGPTNSTGHEVATRLAKSFDVRCLLLLVTGQQSPCRSHLLVGVVVIVADGFRN